jgi:hypothetical protein
MMLSAALQLAFFGMLRVSEYTAQSSTSWDVERALSPRDVAVGWSSRVVSVTIKVSKKDPFRIGATIKVCETGSQLCPFSALVRYLQIRGASEGHLFIFESGEFPMWGTMVYSWGPVHMCVIGVGVRDGEMRE